MDSNGRCACGCRIFYDLPVRITTTNGGAFSIPGAVIVRCVRCGITSRINGDDGERKRVTPFPDGCEAERELFFQALRDWKNLDHPDKNPDFITIEEADKQDFEALEIDEKKFRETLK